MLSKKKGKKKKPMKTKNKIGEKEGDIRSIRRLKSIFIE